MKTYSILIVKIIVNSEYETSRVVRVISDHVIILWLEEVVLSCLGRYSNVF